MYWSTTFCDLNNDNTREIVASNTDGSNYQKLYVLDDHLVPINSSTITGTVVCSNDLNGDGYNEVVLMDQTTLKILDHNLNLITSRTFPSISKCIISDLDKNGVNELLVLADSIYSFEFANSSGIIDYSTLSAGKACIYPNPVTNKTNIRFYNPDHQNYQLTVTDILGNTVFTEGNITTDNIAFEKGTLETGIYFVKICGKFVYLGKLILE